MELSKMAEVGLGVLLFTGTIASPIPGDELIGMPIGAALIAHGFGYLK